MYPVDKIHIEAETVAALAARAELEASAGDVAKGIGTYQELLGKLADSLPDAKANLEHANDFSNIYQSLAGLQRQAGDLKGASATDARRRQIWQQWDRKMPGNAYVRRQLTTFE